MLQQRPFGLRAPTQVNILSHY